MEGTGRGVAEAVREVLADFDPGRPLSRARTLPKEWYTWEGVAELEREAVFGQTWQAVGRRELVAEAGSYVTFAVAGEPVVVVRGEDGVLRGFINVCRHKAARVCTAEQGRASKLRCRYHGWTYDLRGRLRGVPEFAGVEEFDREANGLPEVATAEWGPYVWVHLGQPATDLESYLHPLPQWAADRQAFQGLVWHERRVYDLACNWKVYVDNYLDGGYHVNTVHPGLSEALQYRDYRTICEGATVLQVSPLQAASGAVGRTRSGDLAAYWWVYPNVMFNIYPGVMDCNIVVPLGVERCRVLFDLYFAEGTPPDFIAESLAVTEQVQREDMEVCEEVQRNLHSRSYRYGRFSVERENGGYYFHQLLGRALQEAAGVQPRTSTPAPGRSA
ncbi:aromatic ring-hydroxylating oxygenase subunit alpha [Thermogemmata fonticola]|jgi:choline monooxygenase|uniref:Aromatic ring-hydroxylating dioxygenase subunit alpha n=1 Tax=Thermogemmata fonticola TaxID=2755323 RepID=A0A7V8VDT8_9BACT|nr:aromatic ring-hydroxylating dioxygenase subunit alpha [Thermogemmata fonticola]MBA2226214.1 aromatic ring-hydroxylating dioxygenase subunit alpha [Thermogemmata fonticola]